MSGIINALIGILRPSVFLIYVYNLTGGGASGATARAQFLNNGQIVGALNSSNLGSYIITNQLSGNNWYAPTTAGIGSSHYIRAQLVSGITPSGTLNSWTQMTSDIEWSLVNNNSQANHVCQLSVEISPNSSGTPVVWSGTINMRAQTVFNMN